MQLRKVAMMPSIITVALGVFVTAGPLEGRQDPEALALIAAMEIHDASVRTARWHQETSIVEKGERVVLAVCDQACRDDGAWAWRGTWHSKNEELSAWVPTRAEYATLDGVAFLTNRPGTNKPTFRPADGERGLWRTPEMLLGRGLDVNNAVTLWDLLRRAEQLSASRRDSSSLYAVRGIAVLNDMNMVIEVIADADHGFALREIAVYDVLLGNPYLRTTITRFELIAGIHFPVEGTFETYYVDLSEEQAKALGDALKAEGLVEKSDPRDQKIRDAYSKIIPKVFGSGGVPFAPLGVGTMTIVCSDVTLNEPLDDSNFVLYLPPDVKALSAFTDDTLPVSDLVGRQSPMEHAAGN